MSRSPNSRSLYGPVIETPNTAKLVAALALAAGPSLVASAAAENESYLSVILDAREDRFAASIRALEHGFAAYDRVDLILQGERYARADVPYRRGETLGLVAKENVDGFVDGNSRVEREAKVLKDLPGSTRPGT